jgi:hypothetical protein
MSNGSFNSRDGQWVKKSHFRKGKMRPKPVKTLSCVTHAESLTFCEQGTSRTEVYRLEQVMFPAPFGRLTKWGAMTILQP